MKQGSGRNFNGPKKVEPIPHKVSPGGASQIGTMLGNHVTGNGQNVSGASMPLYTGRGYEAPMRSQKTRKGGSQGSY